MELAKRSHSYTEYARILCQSVSHYLTYKTNNEKLKRESRSGILRDQYKMSDKCDTSRRGPCREPRGALLVLVASGKRVSVLLRHVWGFL